MIPAACSLFILFLRYTHAILLRKRYLQKWVVSIFGNYTRCHSPLLVTMLVNRYFSRNNGESCLQRSPSELPPCHPPLNDVFYGGRKTLSSFSSRSCGCRPVSCLRTDLGCGTDPPWGHHVLEGLIRRWNHQYQHSLPVCGREYSVEDILSVREVGVPVIPPHVEPHLSLRVRFRREWTGEFVG